jgi:hypothetical protein
MYSIIIIIIITVIISVLLLLRTYGTYYLRKGLVYDKHIGHILEDFHLRHFCGF